MATTTTSADGQFIFSDVGAGKFRAQVEASNFAPGFGAGGTGVSWLGGQSLTPTGSLSQTEQALLSVPLVDIAMIVAYLWIWAGFTMVVVGAGPGRARPPGPGGGPRSTGRPSGRRCDWSRSPCWPRCSSSSS